MSMLRIRISLVDPPERCQWVLVSDGHEPVAGEGLIAELPGHVDHVQLVIPAAQVLITRLHLPHAARRQRGSVLAYAVEDQIAGEPDASQVNWIGSVGEDDVLAIIDKQRLKTWCDALEASGINDFDIQCETLLLPLPNGGWSIAWNGCEGFVRCGVFEGSMTDRGGRETPPLALNMMLESAQTQGIEPASIEIYASVPDAMPDLEAWTRKLGVAVHFAGAWSWRTTLPDAGVSLVRKRKYWRSFSGTLIRLRPAAWILGAALAIQAVALLMDWTYLANEQRSLRQQMESRFRETFPDAVAVVDPALQMRRKLAEARHAIGQSDDGDFLPMIERVAATTKSLPAGSVRTLSYESGRMTMELTAPDKASVQRIVLALRQSGLVVDALPVQGPSSTPVTGMKVILTVRVT
jgi:general secretion pathway protein L